MSITTPLPVRYISTHTLTWSVTRLENASAQNLHFNSHAHVERDAYSFYRSSAWKISTHTLTWSVTRSCLHSDSPSSYFNSHAHVERDVVTYQHIRITAKISTHTLTWSVTRYPFSLQVGTGISTHTLTWSVTKRSSNSFYYIRISTHTLTWSVTTEDIRYKPIIKFQLTRSRGA